MSRKQRESTVQTIGHSLATAVCGLGMVLAAGVARAEIPEPDHIVYGTPTVDGAPVAQGVVSLVLDGEGAAIASYAIGSDPLLGGLYALRVPMDSTGARQVGSARSGDQAAILLDGQAAGRVTIGQRGSAQLLDVDPADAEAVPVLSVADVALEEGDAGSVEVVVAITLSVASDTSVTVDWVTDDGSAIGAASCAAGGDFVAASGQATIDPGNSGTTVSVTVCGEVLEELDEHFFLNLLNPVSAALLDPQGKVTIVDDDTPPQLSVNNVTVTEPPTGSVMAGFRVSLTKVWEQSVSFGFATGGGDASAGLDYLATSGSATIPAGALATIVEVEILADTVDEADETFFLTLSSPLGASLLDGQGQATIVDQAQLLLFVEAELDGVAGVDGLAGAAAVAVSPDGDHVYAVGGSEDALAVFDRDPVSADLSLLEVYRPTDFANRYVRAFAGLDGPEAVVVSGDGRHVYVASYNDDTVTVFARNAVVADPGYGQLTLLEVEDDGVNDLSDTGGTVNGLDGASALALSPGGDFLYVVGSVDGAVAVFRRDSDELSPSFGRLSFVEAEVDGVDDPGDIGGVVDGLFQATAVVVSPDGANVYVSSAGDRAVAVFARTTAPGSNLGRLSFSAVHKDSVGGVDGLNGAADLAISGDGLSLYVAGQLDSALAVFVRAGDGSLGFLQAVSDGSGTVEGLGGVASVAVSVDGRFVYAASSLDHALAAFERAPDGSLSPVELKVDGRGGVDGLFGATDIAVTADDGGVLVAAGLGNGLAVFARDLSAPQLPTSLASTSHVPGAWSNDAVVDVAWSGASDGLGGAGVAGYSLLFDRAAGTLPDETMEVTHTLDPHGASSGPLADGDDHYLHLRACDHARNCSAAAVLGPFAVDTVPPGAASGITSTSHVVGVPSYDTVVDMAWTAAVDPGPPASGVAGYSYVFSTNPAPACNGDVDLPGGATASSSAALTAGSWYFHLCAVDVAGTWGAVASAGPYEIQDDLVPPKVLALQSVAAPAAGTIAEGAVLDRSLTQLLVTFSKGMADPVGNGTPGDVTNPATARLVNGGSNGILETVGCATLAGDDQLTPVDGIVYDPVANVAALAVGGGWSLPLGTHRLILCANGALADGNGNPLDGDGNGAGGDDYVRTFTVVRDGLLANPNLDHGSTAWSVSDAVRITADAEDADGAPTSGSLLVTRPGPADPGRDWAYSIAQCVQLSAADQAPFHLSGRVMMEEALGGDPGAATAVASVTFNNGVACNGSQVGPESASNAVVDDTAGTWQALTAVAVARPAGAQSALVVFSVSLPLSEDFPFLAWFDNLAFQVTDVAPPSQPALASTSHTAATWSTLNQIQMTWSGASDGVPGSGLAGYSYLFDGAALTTPDSVLEAAAQLGPSSTSVVVADGVHYFHLRSCDVAGNCTSALHGGWYGVDTQAPPAPAGVASSSHVVGVSDVDAVIEMSWSPTSDVPGGAGLVGLAYQFTSSASPVCDGAVDLPASATAVASPGLLDGTYYFHLCAVDGAGLVSPTTTRGPYVVNDTRPPTVAWLDTVVSTADGALAPGETLQRPVTRLVVDFAEPMGDPAGDSTREDVTNPDNYRLIEAGTNGLFDTLLANQCQGTGGDDVPVLIDSASYSSELYAVSPRVAAAASLPPGRYRFAVCGVSGLLNEVGIADFNGNQLDGDGNGVAGDNFLVDFRVSSDNRLLNPNFDGDLAAWTLAPTAPATFFYGTPDADGAWSSGSASIRSEIGAGVTHSMSQCVAGSGDGLEAVGQVRLATLGSADPRAWIEVRHFSGTGCTGSLLATDVGVALVGSTGTAFVDLPPLEISTSAGTQSLRVVYRAAAGTPAPAAFVARFDSLGLATPVPLFADGFEGGSTSGWSVAVP